MKNFADSLPAINYYKHAWRHVAVLSFHIFKLNAITYCHYPLVTEFSRAHDLAYLEYLRDLGLVKVDAERMDNNDMRSKTQNSVLISGKNSKKAIWLC